MLNHVNNVEYIDVRDKIQVKTLLTKTFYELNETDTLMHNLDSSKHFLNNNKSVSGEFRTSYGNFFYFLTKIAVLKESPDSFSTQKLKNEIEIVSELSEKQWLLEKIAELEK